MMMIGTPLYVAPEVIDGKHYGVLCDMWSLGVIIYRMLSGKEAFIAESIVEVYNKISSADYNFDDEIWEKVSGDAKDFINKLLVPDPALRLTSAQAKNHLWFKRKSA